MWSNNEYKRSNPSDGWTCERINKLVRLYQKNTCLWKKDDCFYLDCKKRYNAYKNMCKNLSQSEVTKVTFIQVLMKIREVRRLYVHELKKIFYAQSNRGHYEPSFPWFWRLHQFLHPYLDHEESLELRKALFNLTREQEDGVRLQSRNKRRKIRKSSKRSRTREVVKQINEKEAITFERNSSLCSSSNCQLSDLDSSCKPSTRTRKNLDVKNKVSNCFTNLTIATCSNKALSVLENETSSQKTYILKNNEPVSMENEQNTCGSLSKIESCNRSDISCLTVRKFCDQFDFFAKSVACQLRKMNMHFALKAQKAIRKILKNPETLEKEFLST